MRSLTDTTPGSHTEQHGEQREAKRCDCDDERRAGTGEPEAGRGHRIERQADVDPGAEQPEVDRCAPEHHEIDLQAVLEGPQQGKRHERNRNSDGHDEYRFEGGEEGGEGTIHTEGELTGGGEQRRGAGPRSRKPLRDPPKRPHSPVDRHIRGETTRSVANLLRCAG